MKYLKIENHKGYFRLDPTEEKWIELDQINKDNLLQLLKIAASSAFEMDEFKSELLQNPAHNIIYSNLYIKLQDFLSNKTRFQDSVEATYKSAIDKYTLVIEK